MKHFHMGQTIAECDCPIPDRCWEAETCLACATTKGKLMTPAELIKSYIEIRDKKRDLELRHKEALKPYAEAMSRIETALGLLMEETGLDNLPGGGGTAYRTTRSTVTVDDWDTFVSWVAERGAWHMLERRAAKTAVEEVLEETEELPPGISISRAIVVQVRKN